MASVYDIANYFLCLDEEHNGDGISPLKLQKLVYYAQGFYCALNDKPLFSDDIKAWTHGSVVESLYHHYKEYGKHPIPTPRDFSTDNLSADEAGVIEEVFEVFGQFSAWKLRNMTHEEQPWIAHELLADIIPLAELGAYFKTRIH